jgi:hypothetical protein
MTFVHLFTITQNPVIERMNHKPYFLLLLIVTLLTGCRKETHIVTTMEEGGDAAIEADTVHVKIPTKNYFFDFDEAIFYSGTRMRTTEIFEKDHHPNKKIGDSIVAGIVTDWDHQLLIDKKSLAYLDSLGFDRRIIPVSEHKFLTEIFREKNYVDYLSETTCAPIFCDIYVFKKKGEIIGIAKLGYNCHKHVIRGTKANTSGFGKNGEYEQLRELMNNNN